MNSFEDGEILSGTSSTEIASTPISKTNSSTSLQHNTSNGMLPPKDVKIAQENNNPSAGIKNKNIQIFYISSSNDSRSRKYPSSSSSKYVSTHSSYKDSYSSRSSSRHSPRNDSRYSRSSRRRSPSRDETPSKYYSSNLKTENIHSESKHSYSQSSKNRNSSPGSLPTFSSNLRNSNIKNTVSLNSAVRDLSPKPYSSSSFNNTDYHNFNNSSSKIAIDPHLASDSSKKPKPKSSFTSKQDSSSSDEFSEFSEMKNEDEELELQRRRERRLAILKKYNTKKTSGSSNPEVKDLPASSLNTSADSLKGNSSSFISVPNPPIPDPRAIPSLQPLHKVLPTINPALQAQPEVKESIIEPEFDMFGSEYKEPESKPESKHPTTQNQISDVKSSHENTRADSLSNNASLTNTNITGLEDNWDDEEGYYRVVIGEKINNRYIVDYVLGQGVFSTVVAATDTYTLNSSKDDQSNNSSNIAIKIIRNNETMHKLAKHEIEILLKILNSSSKSARKYIVQYIDSFEYRNHLCLVFEKLDMNLRQTLKLFGLNVGLHLNAVKLYGHHLFCALLVLEKRKIVHADLKLDNILVSKSKKYVKLADFGSALSTIENAGEPNSEYLVSRFYRPPEIILGYEYTSAVDVWGLGCTLFELFTGKVLFPGRSNNQMLKLMMDLKGRFPNKMLRKSKLAREHFVLGGSSSSTLSIANLGDSLSSQVTKNSLLFISKEIGYDYLTPETNGDNIDLEPNSRNLHAPSPVVVTKHINYTTTASLNNIKRLLNSSASSTTNILKEHLKMAQFADLLDKCLELVPEKRITPQQALAHPFFAS
ncbi:hypothetical protein BB560_003288 [Smittium megazygosporum]|uniref:Protein kinase domain-containing protein n=1 Tax=Smittium megazygosporum TaxID=133381 RepID=A0A2T9ZCD3_9FUNG|nr:hypothetical protein BB560_003288 [Smittium megazygosporum]